MRRRHSRCRQIWGSHLHADKQGNVCLRPWDQEDKQSDERSGMAQSIALGQGGVRNREISMTLLAAFENIFARRPPSRSMNRSEEHTSELQSLAYLVCPFFNDTATTEIYTLPLHDALPICVRNREISMTLLAAFENIFARRPPSRSMN